MHKHGLSFESLHKVGVKSLDHPCGHGAVNFKISGCYRVAFLVIGYDYLTHPLPHIFKVVGNSQNSHNLGRNGDGKTGLHHEAVHFAA